MIFAATKAAEVNHNVTIRIRKLMPAIGCRVFAIHAYTNGKDKVPDGLAAFFMALSGVEIGKLNCWR
jgi:hypothetical protein